MSDSDTVRSPWFVAVEDVGIQVGAVWPDDGPQLLVDPHLPEALRVLPQRFVNRAPEVAFEIDFSGAAVVEGEPEDDCGGA